MEHRRILECEPQIPLVGEGRGRPGGTSGLVPRFIEELDEIGVAISGGQSGQVGIGRSLPSDRNPRQICPLGTRKERLVFPLLRIAEDGGTGHSPAEGAGGNAHRLFLLRHGQSGMMPHWSPPGKPLEGMSGVHRVLTVYQ